MRSKSIRVDKEFEKKLRDINKARYDSGLIKLNQRDLGLPEITREMIRTPSWYRVEGELRRRIKK